MIEHSAIAISEKLRELAEKDKINHDILIEAADLIDQLDMELESYADY